MAIQDIQKNPNVSLQNFRWGLITANSANSYIAEAMSLIEGSINANITVNKAEGALYADGYRMIAESSLSSVDITFELVSIPESDAASMLGREWDPITFESIVKASDSAPEICISFQVVKKDGTLKNYRFPVGTAQIDNFSFATKNENLEYQTQTITIKCNPRALDMELWRSKLDDGADTTYWEEVEEPA